MKFSESVALRLPKKTISPEEYTILARSRYSPRYGIERTERVNPQELAHVPEILQKVGFVVVRNILTESATTKVRGASLRNKGLVSALQQAWERLCPEETPPEAQISFIGNDPVTGVRFNQPGLHLIAPDGRQTVAVTKRWHQAQTQVHPGDAFLWEQEEGYFPSVELHNTSRHYLGAFVLHESVAYSRSPVAPGPPSVSQ